MSVIYDYDIASHDDPILNAAKRALDLFTRVATPEKAALFGAFPFCKCLYCWNGVEQNIFCVRVVMKLPSWIPGLGFKEANVSKQYAKDMLDMPYQYVIRSRASSTFAVERIC